MVWSYYSRESCRYRPSIRQLWASVTAITALSVCVCVCVYVRVCVAKTHVTVAVHEGGGALLIFTVSDSVDRAFLKCSVEVFILVR